MPFCGDMVVAEGQAIRRLQKFEKKKNIPVPISPATTVNVRNGLYCTDGTCRGDDGGHVLTG